MTNTPLRILFMGTPDFAAATLQALLDGPDTVVAVVTQPDRPKGRGKKLTPPPVKVLAQAAGIPVLQPTKIKTQEFRDELAGYKPDVVVVTAYGRILPPALLELAPHGCINVHGSLLPAYRGAAPIQWAVINGDSETGVTIMQMDEGMDTGNILLTAAIPVNDDETAGSLFPKLAALGGTTVRQALALLKEGKLTATVQDDTRATVAPMLKKEDGRIDWQKSAREIHCLIRGLDPWPSAYCFLHGKRLQLFAPEVLHQTSNVEPGTLLAADKRGLLIATGRDCLLVREVQPEGKKRMNVEAFLCGSPVEPGTRLFS
ncbi:methionyl-tRNA formyltransferase [Desulfopila aestuarii]|nr:methionyl-tRNA formyltransferase [Desulfopila aestuarii]